jgi:hypothetical protein
VYLTSENTNYEKTKKNLLQIVPILFWIWFFFTFNQNINDFENFVFFFLTITWIISYLFFAPYLNSLLKTKKDVFYTYFYNISVVILISFVLGWILFALWTIAIATVDALFDINMIWSKTYWNWAILSLGLITPLFLLTQMPNKESFNENYFNENMFFSFLIKFVAIPFISVYFLILYAYSIKVLLDFWDWPKGEISWMVIWFSIFGYITYIFSYIFEEKNKFIKIFRKAFPFIVIAQIFMLFYAIYLRIHQYDITVNRYFVVVFGLWLLVISAYYIFSNKKHLAFIPAVLTLFTVIISVGPWGVYSLPESRQLERLKSNLISANILKDWNIIPLKNYKQIDKQLSKNIYSGIDYICNFNDCDNIKKLFPTIYKEVLKKDKMQWEKNKTDNMKMYKENIEKNDKKRNENYKELLEEISNKKYKWPNKWKIIDEITRTIKVEKYYSSKTEREYINIYIENNYEWLFPISTEWYSKILELRNIKSDSTNIEYANIDIENEKIEIIKEWIITKEIDIKNIVDNLTKKYNLSGEKRYLKKDLTFNIEKIGKKYKVIFNSIYIKNPKYEWKSTIWGYEAYGYLLY